LLSRFFLFIWYINYKFIILCLAQRCRRTHAEWTGALQPGDPTDLPAHVALAAIPLVQWSSGHGGRMGKSPGERASALDSAEGGHSHLGKFRVCQEIRKSCARWHHWIDDLRWPGGQRFLQCKWTTIYYSYPLW